MGLSYLFFRHTLPPYAQTMTHTYLADDSILVHLLVVSVACDSN
jgi:hypothetical protein